ncbi:unnamed protein product [Eruca vesicaria subsp. sativa]|uniref:Uncharacterized protein n=1 Tax=Eruca vesicaria subsp. sativa TaxID=29727 RepID=A0ABC8LI00_ERUVS|nr:unnamed protein product [Eruca vesicaria subsp. sativa]
MSVGFPLRQINSQWLHYLFTHVMAAVGGHIAGQGDAVVNINMLQLGPVATIVVCLTQVVTEDDLRDYMEYEDIMEDISHDSLLHNLLELEAPIKIYGDIHGQ